MSTLRNSDQVFYPRLIDHDPEAKPGDMLAAIQLPPVQFEEFYQRQSESLKRGNILQSDGVNGPEANPCPVCGGCEQIDLHTMHKVSAGHWEQDVRFTLCLTCFTAIEELQVDVPKPCDYV